MKTKNFFRIILVIAITFLLISALSACSMVGIPFKRQEMESSQAVETEAQNDLSEAAAAESETAKEETEQQPEEETSTVAQDISSVSESETAQEETPQPFYGLWVAAFKSEKDAQDAASKLQEKGFNAVVLISSEWSNLNQESWYVVSAGSYPTEDAAKNDLSAVKSAGYDSAYVKYTGNWKG